MDRKEFEQEIAEFLGTSPSPEDRLRVAATLLHQSSHVVAVFGEHTRGAVEDALQAVLDTADQMHIDVWED